MNAIEELAPQVGTAAACRSLGVPRATLYRHRQPKPIDPTIATRPAPPRALCEQERQQILDVLDSEPFADKAPAEVYRSVPAITTPEPSSSSQNGWTARDATTTRSANGNSKKWWRNDAQGTGCSRMNSLYSSAPHTHRPESLRASAVRNVLGCTYWRA